MALIVCECEHESHHDGSAHPIYIGVQHADRIETMFGAFVLCAECIQIGHGRIEETEFEFDPDNGDIVVSGERFDSQIMVATQYGKVIAKGWDSIIDIYIRQHMEKTQFWPNVWNVSDHGNASLRPLDAKTDLSTPVYVGSIGWRDCDPFLGVVAFELSQADSKIAELLREETERANNDWIPETCSECDPETCDCDDCDCDDPDIDDLIDYGTSAESLGWWIENAMEREETLNDLLTDGIAVL